MEKKILIALSMLLLTMTILPTTVFAHDITSANQSTIENTEITLRGNITGYIYKIYNGKQWKRLWSYTYNRWEEPDWTLA